MTFSDAEIKRDDRVTELKGEAWLTSPISRTIVNSHYAALISLAINPIPERLEYMVDFLIKQGTLPSLRGFQHRRLPGDKEQLGIIEEFFPLLADPPKLSKRVLKSAERAMYVGPRLIDCIHRGALFHAHLSYALNRDTELGEAVEFAQAQTVKPPPAIGFLDKQNFFTAVCRSQTGAFMRFLAFTGAVMQNGKLGELDLTGISPDHSKIREKPDGSPEP